MRFTCKVVLFVTFIVSTACDVAKPEGKIGAASRLQPSAIDTRSLDACTPPISVQGVLQVLSSGNRAESEKMRATLVKSGEGSLECRDQIVQTIMGAMDRPDLDFTGHRPMYNLWYEGSLLLGNLKATEALDLLISHLDENDGLFSASMDGEPAVIGVSLMGPAAVPKLSVALQENPNRDIRLAAANCLYSIGGRDARSAMIQALQSETDKCVQRYMRLALEITGRKWKADSPHASSADLQELSRAQLRLFLAYKCDR